MITRTATRNNSMKMTKAITMARKLRTPKNRRVTIYLQTVNQFINPLATYKDDNFKIGNKRKRRKWTQTTPNTMIKQLIVPMMQLKERSNWINRRFKSLRRVKLSSYGACFVKIRSLRRARRRKLPTKSHKTKSLKRVRSHRVYRVNIEVINNKLKIQMKKL